MICEFCENNFSSISNLVNHQKTDLKNQICLNYLKLYNSNKKINAMG